LKYGHWIPISKTFKKALPHDRAYTELEAAFSLQLDYDGKKTATVAGYADLWRWSRKRVYNFLKRMNIKILYPKNTAKKQNQRGIIGVQIPPQIKDRYGADKGQIRLIENKGLQEGKNRKGTDKGQIRDRKGSTTIDPKPKPDPKPKIFSLDSNEFRLSKLLYALLLKINPGHKEPNLQDWALHINRAIRLDKRSPEDLEKVMRWALADSFWQSNVQCTSKLREQFDKLTIKMGSNNGTTIQNAGKPTAESGKYHGQPELVIEV